MIRNLLLFALLIVAISASYVRAEVITIKTPHDGLVPEIVLDDSGILHLTYGRGGNGYYVQSRDSGKTFSQPVQVNQRADTVTVGGERSPKLAIGKDGVIHVAWLGHYQRGGGVWYTRSTDGGQTFEPERSLLDTRAGTDSVTIIADKEGNLFAFWLDARLPKDEQSPVAHPIFMTRSTDNGLTFSPNQPLKHDHPGSTCACCRLEARIGDDGYIYLAFRSGYQSIRDLYLLKGRKTENNFKSVRVSVDDWKLEGCPMSGAPFGVDSSGRVIISWMSQGKVYWSISDKGATRFVPRIAAPDGGSSENHPTVLINRKGEVLLIWKQGAQVRWARYTVDGKFTGASGTVGELPGRNKPTAFIGADDNLYIVL